MSLAPGARLGGYEVIGLLGAGGMGEVYRALDTKLRRDVAIKLVKAAFCGDVRDQLHREARAAAALNHPHICTIHEIADADDQLFIVMEHVAGRQLSALVAEALPTSSVIHYGGQIADALAHSHQRGVIHRDLKSANIMVMTDGRVKVLDFGIAALAGDAATDAATRAATSPGTIVGTTAYLAPEILKGAEADCRCDIWALGVVMYEMARGERPFGGRTSFEVTSAILRDEPAPLRRTVSAPLRGVIARCLAKDPALRYQHAGEVRAALEAIATVRTPRGRAVTGPVGAARSLHDAPAEKSILVMPFENLSSDAGDAYFSDGLTDELITDLSRIAGLRVVPAAASFRLRGTNKHLAAIARDFKVTHIVEGRVRKAADDVRITAQLVDVAGDRTVWADKYSGDLAQAFALQERVSGAIAEALQLRLRLARRTPKPGAVEAFLKGRHFARQATSAGFQKALACFEEATHLDGDYAAAFAALAETYVTLTTAWQALRALDTMPKAVAAARRALEIDPQLAEAHVTRGLVAMYCEWDLQTAERAFNEALRINPNNVEAHKRYSELLIWLDTRYHEALRHVRSAVALDPVDPWAQVHVCWVHYFSRDFHSAIEQARQVVALEPLYGYGHYALGCALLTSGHCEEAMVCFNRSIQLDGRTSHCVALLGIAYAVTGRHDEALGCLTELDALDQEGRSVAVWKLHVYAGLADADNVITCLKVAIDQRNSSTLYMLTHPYTDFVRRDPRFAALLQQAGLGHLAMRTFEPEWSPLKIPCS